MENLLLVLLVLLAASLTAAMVLWRKNRKLAKAASETELRFKQLEESVNRLQMESLQFKLSPHLFKNILNSVQSHAYQTYYALDKLANVLDYILYESDKQYVTLKEELEFAASLIEINRLKVSPLMDLKIKNRIDESSRLYLQPVLPPLITVDLIENAFKHADLTSSDAFIAVVFELKDTTFSLTVSNKIKARPALRKNKSGFGNESLRTRLEAFYKGNYTLEQVSENNVFIAHLKINLLGNKVKVPLAG
ncbi:sensor histidine kinase [Pontibacter sp. SGAir0037]|uniref:sensor histidine kinase n=1 Tax=Pontibacter sp. SGAir0037 TaxID=2571030 RepID=UPI0010CCBB43|nr:histidine kinase [Pontibacter sp. SGAir0037]QCR22566.1 histidine kinase [Pontibacter sp. SGAir0037]